MRDVEVRIGSEEELLVRSPGVMLGYWNDKEKTHQVIDEDGWLHTGDQARINKGHIYLVGRLKEILMIIGERRPFLGALVVLNPERWEALAKTLGLAGEETASLAVPAATKAVLERIAKGLHDFPGYAQVYGVHLTLEPWTVENGLLTPTLKLRRARIMAKYQQAVDTIYAGH